MNLLLIILILRKTGWLSENWMFGGFTVVAEDNNMSKEMQELQKQWHSVVQSIHSNSNVGLDYNSIDHIYKDAPFITLGISHPNLFKCNFKTLFSSLRTLTLPFQVNTEEEALGRAVLPHLQQSRKRETCSAFLCFTGITI